MRITIPVSIPVIALILTCCIFMTGCGSSYQGNFAVLAPDPVEGSIDYSTVPRTKYTMGKDKQEFILLFIPIGHEPTVRGAIEDALAQENGDVMLDTDVYFESFSFPYLYDKYEYVVEGIVINSQDHILSNESETLTVESSATIQRQE